ncbi:MAG TPA: hypothetical protein DIC64_02330 [Alphaproteobacteria bacterium]|nr:hypothetical protein [Alphaproteobacteria bacterium]
MQKIIFKITKENSSLAADSRFECFILSEDLPSHFKQEFASSAKQSGKLVLGLSLSDVLAYHLDGIVLDLSKSEHIKKDFREQTKDLKNKFIGVICRNRRHEAMIVSECEPDFLIFRAWQDGIENIKELTSWYNEMFLIQSALYPQEDIDYQSFETDFVILDK